MRLNGKNFINKIAGPNLINVSDIRLLFVPVCGQWWNGIHKIKYPMSTPAICKTRPRTEKVTACGPDAPPSKFVVDKQKRNIRATALVTV